IKVAHFFFRIRLALLGSFAKPVQRLRIVEPPALSGFIQYSQVVLRQRISLHCGLAIERHCPPVRLWHTQSALVHHSQPVLRCRKPLIRGLLIQSQRFFVVLPDSESTVIAIGQRELRGGVTAFRCPTQQRQLACALLSRHSRSKRQTRDRARDHNNLGAFCEFQVRFPLASKQSWGGQRVLLGTRKVLKNNWLIKGSPHAAHPRRSAYRPPPPTAIGREYRCRPGVLKPAISTRVHCAAAGSLLTRCTRAAHTRRSCSTLLWDSSFSEALCAGCSPCPLRFSCPPPSPVPTSATTTSSPPKSSAPSTFPPPAPNPPKPLSIGPSPSCIPSSTSNPARPLWKFPGVIPTAPWLSGALP